MRAQAIPLHQATSPYQITKSHKSTARYKMNKSLKAVTVFDDDEDKTPPSSVGRITRDFKKIKES